MYAKPMDYEAYVRRKSLPMIDSSDKTSPVGLFSPEIFGVTEAERVSKPALINLGMYVMRPLILNLMKRINRKIVQAAITRCEVYLRDGKIEIKDSTYEEQPGDIQGRSGPQFLYDNWDKIDKKQFMQDIGRYSNIQAKKTLSFMSKDEVFQHYVYVIPVGYREEDQDSIMIVNDINNLYSDIIRYSRLIINGVDGIDKTDISVLLQKAVLDFGEYIIDRYLGPKGVGRKQILSRAVDNSARMVLLTNNYTGKKLGTSKVKLGSCQVPIHHLTSMFRDTVLKFSTDLINLLYADGCFPEDTPQDMLIFYDMEFMTDQISKFKDVFQRVQNFPGITADGNFKPVMVPMKVTQPDGTVEDITKPLSWLEFFYIVLNGMAKITETRYTAVTRYPIDSVLSQQYLRPVVGTMSADRLRHVELLGMEFDDFPYVDDWLKENYQEKVFENGIRADAATTVGFNGDHDRSLSTSVGNLLVNLG